MTMYNEVSAKHMMHFKLRLLVAVLLFCTVGLFSNPASAKTGEQEEIVLLLHGLGRTDRSMAKMASKLQQAGYAIENIDYPSTKLSVSQISNHYLSPTVEWASAKYKKVHIVTHSMGGIITRQYLAEHGPGHIGRVVMLAPPNHGSEVIDNLGKMGLVASMLGPGAAELSTADDSVPNSLPPLKCNDCEVGIIAGSRSYNPLFSYWVKGEDDGKVSVQSTILEGMSDHLVVKANHTFIMRNNEVIEQVIHFLKAGQFRNDSRGTE